MKRVWHVAMLLWGVAYGGRFVYAIDMVIIPVTYYEKQGNSFVMKSDRRNITGDMIDWLGKYHEVREDRTRLQDRLAGVTDTDARRVAAHYEVNYVLFGAVKEDEQSLSAEFKIYDTRQEQYELFFAGDRRDRYERLIQTVCEHILDWFHTDRDKVDVLRSEVKELRKELERVREASAARREQAAGNSEGRPAKELSMRIPLRAGYWSYVERDWVGLVRGTVEASSGIELYPQMQMPLIGGMRNEFSWDILFGYRYGDGAKGEEVQTHQITVNPLLGYHINFYTANWLTLGLGFFFEYGIWNVEEQAYQQSFAYNQSLTGVTVLVEYGYRFNRYLTFNVGAMLYSYFVADTSLLIRAHAGMVITVVGGEYEK